MAPENNQQLEQAESIRATATNILARRGWSLLSVDDLATRVTELLADGTFTDAGLAVFHTYAQVLYHACSGAEGAERQQVAYQELARYLHDLMWRVAADLAPDEREESVNQALAEVFYRLTGQGATRKLSAVREPGAFLAVAVQQLRNVVRRWRRDSIVVWDELDDEQEITAGADERPEYLIESYELRRRVKQCFLNSLRTHPRARLQLWVVWLRDILDIDYETISVRYQMSAENIRILHSRGLKKLRMDTGWDEIARELGLLVTAEHGEAFPALSETKGVS